MPTVADVVAAVDARYDPSWAADWDAVGLVCGDPAAAVSRVLFAVDPVEAVVEEAARTGVQLILTHHPLLLSPVHGVAETTAKGRLVARLIKAGIALHVAHTNADVADPGVSDALAAAVGLSALSPLEPGPRGLGRVGHLAAPMSLADFARAVAEALPATVAGVRAAGDPATIVRRVAVCGGSGGSLGEAARTAGAEVLLTADLRHHAVSEALEDGGLCFVEAAHWATEWPWLPVAAARLRQDLGASVETAVSTLVTDPWSVSVTP